MCPQQFSGKALIKCKNRTIFACDILTSKENGDQIFAQLHKDDKPLVLILRNKQIVWENTEMTLDNRKHGLVSIQE